MRRVVKLGALVFLALMLLATMPSVGLARIRAAKLGDLVGNSDLIVVGRVESTRLTRPALWRRVTLTASLGVFATGAFLMLRRKRKTLAAVLVCISLLGLLECSTPCATYSTVADLSVSRIVQGQLTDGEITIWYGGGIPCDETDLDVGQEYLLFLKRLSSGYTVSWYQFSVWTYRSGYVQRNPWAGTGMRIAGSFSIYFTGSEVSFAFPSPLLSSPSCPSDTKKYRDRLLPGLLPIFRARRTLDQLSTDCYPVGIPKFIPELLGCRRVDVACKPMSVGRWVMCVRNRWDLVPGDVVSRPFVPDSDTFVPTPSTWRAGCTPLKEKPIEIRQPSTCPSSIGESGVGQLPRTRKSLGGGPSSPFASPTVKLSAVRVDASILTPRSDHVFCG